jgi:polar amino acid transport system substrate-binding protein
MVAKALGVKLELQQVTGANRIPFLLTDKVDIVISVMGLTPERAKQIMFTSPYADTKLAVFGPKSADVPSADKIGSLKIAAAKGTTQELALTAMAPKATIMRTEDDATAAAAYLSGQAELFATNTLIIPTCRSATRTRSSSSSSPSAAAPPTWASAWARPIWCAGSTASSSSTP